MSDYNGWTNYATWLVNLEMIDGIDPRDMGWNWKDKFDLAECLKDLVEETLGENSENSFALRYAIAFLSDVNWREIADHMIDTYAEEEDAA